MRQRGRKSAELIALNVQGLPPRLQPPSYLNAKERKAFETLIAATDVRHFSESDIPMIVSFVQASLLVHAAARKQDAETFEKLSRVQAMLATKLRLTVQSRADPKNITRMQPYSGPRPWE